MRSFSRVVMYRLSKALLKINEKTGIQRREYFYLFPDLSLLDSRLRHCSIINSSSMNQSSSNKGHKKTTHPHGQAKRVLRNKPAVQASQRERTSEWLTSRVKDISNCTPRASLMKTGAWQSTKVKNLPCLTVKSRQKKSFRPC